MEKFGSSTIYSLPGVSVSAPSRYLPSPGNILQVENYRDTFVNWIPLRGPIVVLLPKLSKLSPKRQDLPTYFFVEFLPLCHYEYASTSNSWYSNCFHSKIWTRLQVHCSLKQLQAGKKSHETELNSSRCIIFRCNYDALASNCIPFITKPLNFQLTGQYSSNSFSVHLIGRLSNNCVRLSTILNFTMKLILLSLVFTLVSLLLFLWTLFELTILYKTTPIP